MAASASKRARPVSASPAVLQASRSSQSRDALVGRSVQAVNEAIPRLVDAGVLTQTTVGKRNRAFEAKEPIDSFTALERQLASPDRDTRSSPPSRRVPARRSG
jgi:hypothetical protein